MSTPLAAALAFLPLRRRPLLGSHVRAVLVGILAALVLNGGGDGTASSPQRPRRRAAHSAACAARIERGRAEYPLALLTDLPRLWPGDLPKVAQSGGRSSMASPECALYIEAPGEGAPLGLRLLGWTTAFAAAENFGVTFVHTSFDGPGGSGAASDGGTDADAPRGGWDDALGLGAGEPTAQSLRAAAAAAGRPAMATKHLDSWRGVRYDEDVFRRGPWWGDLNEQPSNCGKLLRVPPLARAYDASWLTKGATALRFARARERRAALGLDPPLQWDAERDVNIAVHVRRVVFSDAAAGTPFEWDGELALASWERGEGGESSSATGRAAGDADAGDGERFLGQRVWYPTREAVLARVVRETVLPALLAEGLPAERIVVHVFSQWPSSADFPALAALAGVGREKGGGRGVRVVWQLGSALTAWATLLHLAQSDVLVGSASHLSFFAAHLSSRPLVLAQEDFDKWRLCGEGAACCRRDGVCEFVAEVRMREAARRLGALRRCGAGLA